jgi:hypothetical protein
VKRYRVRCGSRGKFDVVELSVARRSFRVRGSAGSKLTVRRVGSPDEGARAQIAKAIVWVGLASVLASEGYALVTGNHDDLRELRQGITTLVTFVLGYYFGKHNFK